MSTAVAEPKGPMTVSAMLASMASMGSVRIVSVFPVEYRKEMQVEQGFKTYVIPAADRDNWTYCDVENAFIWVPDFGETALTENRGRAPMRQEFVSAVDRAAALVKYWAGEGVLAGAAGGGRPGIAALPPGQTEPSAEFLAELRKVQDLYADAYIKHGNDMHTQGKHMAITTQHHRLAAWKMGSAAGRLPWYPMKEFQELKRCIACSEEIPYMAARCKHCQVDLMDYYRKHGLDFDSDPALAALRSARVVPEKGPKVNVGALVRERLDQRDAELGRSAIFSTQEEGEASGA